MQRRVGLCRVDADAAVAFAGRTRPQRREVRGGTDGILDLRGRSTLTSQLPSQRLSRDADPGGESVDGDSALSKALQRRAGPVGCRNSDGVTPR